MFWYADTIFKIISTLKKIHDLNYCHYDIKNENYFMMNDFTPVVGDLGLLNTPENAKKSHFYGGTKLYLGQNLAKKKVDFEFKKCREDIYALGVTIFSLLFPGEYNYVDKKILSSA